MFGITTRRTPFLATTIALLLGLFCTLLPTSTHMVFAQELAQKLAKSAVAANTTTGSASDTVLLHLAPNLSAAAREQLLVDLNSELVSWMAPINVAEVRLRNDDNSVNAANAYTTAATTLYTRWQQLGNNNNIVEIEPNIVVTGATLPNDPDLADTQRSYGLTLTHAEGAWAYTRGSNEIIIAVIDTGLALNHPEFAGRIIPGQDFVNNDADPSDDNGHGTHTAGIIAAGIDNGIGMAGVCPQCRIMPIKVLNQNNAGTWAGVANGLLYAADHGARVVNLSLGAAVSSKTLEDAIKYAQDKGVLIIAAAGNMGVDRKFFPAAIEGVIAVSATDGQDQRWTLSNYGDYIDVAAPGYAIYSTYNDLTNYYGGYTYMSGTSMASPYVAGLAGLLISQKPSRTATEVSHLIIASADKFGNQVHDIYMGYGRINMQRALAAEADTQWALVDGNGPTQPVTDPSGISTGTGNQTVTAALDEHFFLPRVLK